MTRNHERHRIGRARPSNCANRARFAQSFGDFAVRNRLTVRNRAQLLPNLALKSSRSDIERQIEMWFVVIDVIENFLHRLTQAGIATRDLRFGKLCSQVVLEFRITIGESDSTHTTFSYSDEQTSQ